MQKISLHGAKKHFRGATLLRGMLPPCLPCNARTRLILTRWLRGVSMRLPTGIFSIHSLSVDGLRALFSSRPYKGFYQDFAGLSMVYQVYFSAVFTQDW